MMMIMIMMTKGLGHANGTQEEAFEGSGGEKVPTLLFWEHYHHLMIIWQIINIDRFEYIFLVSYLSSNRLLDEKVFCMYISIVIAFSLFCITSHFPNLIPYVGILVWFQISHFYHRISASSYLSFLQHLTVSHLKPVLLNCQSETLLECCWSFTTIVLIIFHATHFPPFKCFPTYTIHYGASP